MTQKLFLNLYFLSLVIGLLSMTSAFAETVIPKGEQMKSQAALTFSVKNKSFAANLKEGYHFNDKAPNSVTLDSQEIKSSALSPRHIDFHFPKKYKSAKATLYVCDDAITFCETHHITLKEQNQKTKSPEISKKNKPLDVAGFIEGDLKQALALAKSKNQLVLLDFSARWCPGCIRYEKEIFPTAEFKKITKDFVKVKIDVDQFQNFPLSEKYNIVGIPSFVVLNAQQEEVDRLIDFQAMDRLMLFFSALKAEPTPLSQLMTKASADPKSQLQIGLRLYAGGRFSESLPYLEKASSFSPNCRAKRAEESQ